MKRWHRHRPVPQPPAPDRPLPSRLVKRLLPIPALQQLVALGDIATGARRHEVVPAGRTTATQRDHMVQGRLLLQAAIAVSATPGPGLEDRAPKALSPLFLADQEDIIDAMVSKRHQPCPIDSA